MVVHAAAAKGVGVEFDLLEMQKVAQTAASVQVPQGVGLVGEEAGTA